MCETTASRDGNQGTDFLTFGWGKKIRKTDEFSSVFRFRCARRGQGLDVVAGPNGQAYPRLGLIVPKKIITTAVGRNRVKRLLREWFRLHQGGFPGIDVIARLKSRQPESELKVEFLDGLAVCKACVDKRLASLPNQNRTAQD